MNNAEIKQLLGDKYLPLDTHEYVVVNRRASIPKQLEAWFKVGEYTNHGEVMIVMARKLADRPKPPEPRKREEPTKPTGGFAKRAFAAVKGNK